MLKGVSLFFLLIFSVPTLAKETINIGMSTALTGPASELGQNIKLGIESYFNIINERGGINNRQLKLLVRDDGYEPARAAQNMRQLIDKDKVVAIIGNVGTPTAIVSAPIAQQKKTLLFGAFSGGAVLHQDPPERYIINYRPSYVDETATIVDGLIDKGIKPEEIAFFTQRDGYGIAVCEGAIDALARHGFDQADSLLHVRYTRNTMNVEAAAAEILNAPIAPKAIIMAGSYGPSARFIELVHQLLPETWFFNVSFVGSSALSKALPDNIERVVVTQTVPHLNAPVPIVSEFLQALSQYAPNAEPNDVALEGYIVAKLFHQGLLQVDGDITTESIVDGLESLINADIGLGFSISLSKTNHQASQKIWPIYLESGKVEPLNWHKLLEIQ